MIGGIHTNKKHSYKNNLIQSAINDKIIKHKLNQLNENVKRIVSQSHIHNITTSIIES